MDLTSKLQVSTDDLRRLLLVVLFAIFGRRNIVEGQELDPPHDTHNFILGAEEEYIGHWPAQASLQIYGKHRCGAVLLSGNFVLTAAHCVSNKEITYHVVLGRHDLENITIGQKRKVKSIHIHPSYRPLRNDISVLELEEPAELHENVKAALLADSQLNLTETECYITGWGMTDGHTKNLPSTLKEASIQVISLIKCKDILQNNSCCPVSESNVCVYDPYHVKAPCTGDSGGPLFCRYRDQKDWHVVGVTSYVVREQNDTSPCSAKYPSVYSNVSYFVDWIRGIVNTRNASANRVTDFPAWTKDVTNKVTDSSNNEATDAKSGVTDVTVLDNDVHSTTITNVYDKITKFLDRVSQVSVTDTANKGKVTNKNGKDLVTLTFDQTTKNSETPWIGNGVRSNHKQHGGFNLSTALSSSWTVTFTQLHFIYIIFFTLHKI